MQEVIDDNDPRLSKLRSDYGDSICNAVKDGLRELNEYSSRERRIMNEVWNFREGRKATMTEMITCILEQLAVADPGLANAPGDKRRAKNYTHKTPISRHTKVNLCFITNKKNQTSYSMATFVP